jgi:hypothetical protein
MAELIAENERHRHVIAELFERFEGIVRQATHEHIAAPETYVDLVRARLFPDEPA